MQSRLSWMVSMAALYSHPKADPADGAQRVVAAYNDALGTVPYTTASHVASQEDKEAAAAAAKRYTEWKTGGLEEDAARVAEKLRKSTYKG